MDRRWSRNYVKAENREDTSHLREKRLDSLHSSLYLGHKPSESQQENVKPVREPIQRFTIGYHPKNASEKEKVDLVTNNIKNSEKIKKIIPKLDQLKRKQEEINALKNKLFIRERSVKEKGWLLETKQAVGSAQRVTALVRQHSGTELGRLDRQKESHSRQMQKLAPDNALLKKLQAEYQKERKEVEKDLQDIQKGSKPLTDLDATKRELEQSLRIDQSDPVQLKAGVSAIMRNEGPIQLLTEEAHTFRVLDQALADPEINKEFQDLLTVDETCVYPAVAQTALAFKFTSRYSYLSSKSMQDLQQGHSVHKSLMSAQEQERVHYRQALQDIQKQKKAILGDPYDFLLSCSKSTQFTPAVVGMIPEHFGFNVPTAVEDGKSKPQKEFLNKHKTKLQTDISSVPIDATEGSRKVWLEKQQELPKVEHYDLYQWGLTYNNERLSSIDIVSSRGNNTQTYAKISTLDNNNFLKEYFHEDSGFDEGPLNGIIYGGKKLLAGDQYEARTNTRAPQEKHEAAYWQSKEYDWRLPNRDVYYKHIHPKMTRYTQSVIETLEKESGKKEITILDIAGGNGDLAERIVKNAHRYSPQTKINYVLVDYSEKDIKLAQERFSNLHSANVQFKAVHKDMLEYRFDADHVKKDLGLPKEGADIIINSGGLLNASISDNPQQGPAEFNKLYAQLMAPGGYGVYSGLTPLHVSASDHKALGLEVKNLYDFHINRQMHVVRRSPVGR